MGHDSSFSRASKSRSCSITWQCWHSSALLYTLMLASLEICRQAIETSQVFEDELSRDPASNAVCHDTLNVENASTLQISHPCVFSTQCKHQIIVFDCESLHRRCLHLHVSPDARSASRVKKGNYNVSSWIVRQITDSALVKSRYTATPWLSCLRNRLDTRDRMCCSLQECQHVADTL